MKYLENKENKILDIYIDKMSNLNSPSSVSMALLQSKLLSYVPPNSSSPLSDTIGVFMDNILESQWTTMYAGVKAFVAANVSALYPGLRVVVTLSDGQVVLDTAKGTTTVNGASVEVNSFANFKDKKINENHNSRVAILTALLSNAGTGYEEKFSTTELKFEAYHAQRMGASPSDALGVVRVSVLNQ
jgi:hypothetical protein